jgi:GT2 family glycosyltransferase
MEESIAIVILNWNGRKYLEDFLPKVVEHADGCQVVVADNASTDDSIFFIQENFPTVQVILNSENGGFAKGYNDALKHVDTSLYLLLNSDIEVTPGWTLPLREKMKDPTVAGCQPKVLSYSQKDTFEHAGASGGFLDRNYFPFCRGRIFEKFEKDMSQYDNETEIFWATGAALLIRSELYHKVGGLDEAFFAHMEEIDMCWRLKKQGYHFFVVPSSKIYHIGGGTLPYLSPRKTYLNFRNSLFMIVKNHEGPLLPKLVYRMFLDGIGAVRFIIVGQLSQFMSVLWAHVAMHKRMPTLLKQRRQIKQESTTFNQTGWYKGSILWARYFKKITRFQDLNMRLFK